MSWELTLGLGGHRDRNDRVASPVREAAFLLFCLFALACDPFGRSIPKGAIFFLFELATVLEVTVTGMASPEYVLIYLIRYSFRYFNIHAETAVKNSNLQLVAETVGKIHFKLCPSWGYMAYLHIFPPLLQMHAVFLLLFCFTGRHDPSCWVFFGGKAFA